MQDPQTIFADAYHQDDHNAINDVTLLLNLNQSRELITQLNWRPDVLKELEVKHYIFAVSDIESST